MKNLFAPLGIIDDVSILRGENDFLKDFFLMLGISPADALSTIDGKSISLEALLNNCTDLLFPYYNLPSQKKAKPDYWKPFLSNGEANGILNIFHERHAKAIDEAFCDDLKFLMVCSYEYTKTLYCYDIPNGKSTAESNAEESQTILSSFLYKNSIKKQLDNNARALFHRSSNKKDYERVLSNWKTLAYFKQNNIENSGKTVCPQFIRRQDNKNKRASLNDSIFDIGITYGLILGHDPSNSPFIRPVSDYKNMPDPDKENARKILAGVLVDEPQADKEQIPATTSASTEKADFNINDFLDNFVFVNFDETGYNESLEPLNVPLEKYPVDGAPISKHKFSVIENFIVERITNYNYLAKLFELHKWLGTNYHEAELFLEPLFLELMVLPLPNTRILFIDSILKTLKIYKEDHGKPDSAFYSLPASFENILRFEEAMFDIVKKWNQLTVCIAVLLFHYLMKLKPLQTDDYFQSLYNSKNYNFFERRRKPIENIEYEKERKLQKTENKNHTEAFKRHQKGKINKSLKLMQVKEGCVKPVQTVNDNDLPIFSRFADGYYKKFYERTLSFDSENRFAVALLNLRLHYGDYVGALFSHLMIESMGSYYFSSFYYPEIAKYVIRDIRDKSLDSANAEENLKISLKKYIEEHNKNENSQN